MNATEPTIDQIARKRAWQTAMQGLGIDIAVAIAVLVLSSLDGITSKAAAIAFGVSLGKTIVATAAAWVIRRYRDKSGVESIAPAPRRASDG